MPVQFDWVIGNKHIWTQVLNHVQKTDVKLSFDSCLFVLGASGIGKSYHVAKILETHNVYYINSANCTNAKDFRDMLIKGCSPYLVTRTDTSKPFVTLIDDIDILCHLDRTLITTLIDILGNKSGQLIHIPIICIGQLEMEKKLGNTRSKFKVATCCAPTDTDIFMYLKQQPFCAKRTKKVLMQIAEDCNGNLNRAFDLAKGSIEKVKKYENTLLTRISDIRQMMLEDPWMTPLRFHENLPTLLAPNDKMEKYGSLLEYFCLWDQMMSNQGNDLDLSIDILVHAICCQTQTNLIAKDINLDNFTKLLSNLSLQKKNERMLFPSWDHGFPWTHAQIFCEYSKQKWTTPSLKLPR